MKDLTIKFCAKIAGACLLFAAGSASWATAWADSPVMLLEAEQFADTGGWVVDQQFMDQMGSPYLLAHGLGEPVRDAVTTATFPSNTDYHIWVRTRDWVAPWKAPGTPGKFQLLLNGEALPVTFGTEGADWHWQDGGIRKLGGDTKVALHDLTGFEGRCDAVLFCANLDFRPPNEMAALTQFRRQALGLPANPEDGGSYDLVVVGGGIAGTSAAVTAARLGLKVALVQDRPVLGGNGSSEVRVWPEGNIHQKPYTHIGDVVAELVPAKAADDGNAKSAAQYADDRKLAIVRAETNITLFIEHRVNEVAADHGRVRSVVAQDTRTARRLRLSARWFADCTGDADVGYMAGADFEMSSEEHQGASNLWNVKDAVAAKELLQCACKDTNALGSSLVIGTVAVPFPRCPWAVDLTDKPFPGRKNYKGQYVQKEALANLGGWFWESGFNRDPINEVEWMRDQNLRAMYGAWDALKNVDQLYPNYRLGWAAYIAGKRESRRLLGDVILTTDDFLTNRSFADGCFPCSWHIDVHTPDKTFQQGHEGEEFISRATEGEGYHYKGPYWAPYRCLYSRNVTNLFMAGRDISVTHDALGPVRVMRTCGMMGEVVGMAASLCAKYDTTPRGVYAAHLEELKTLMRRGAGNDDLNGLDLGAMVQPVPLTAKVTDPGYHVWCGAPTRAADGKYHLYYSRWPVNNPEGFSPGWAIHSEIAHAVADHPFGPYHFADVALPARGINPATGRKYWDGDMTHNPNIVQRNGKYLLYYIGNYGDGKYPTHRNHDRIGVAIADKPEGPWQRFDAPVIDVSTNATEFDSLCVANPAAAVRPDGGLIVIYKAVPIVPGKLMGGDVRYGVAYAEQPEGPYVKQRCHIFEADGTASHQWMLAEDPFIWCSKQHGNYYYAVARDVVGTFTGAVGGIALFASPDGYQWQAASHPKVLGDHFKWADGTLSNERIERPALLIDGDELVALFGGTDQQAKLGRVAFNVQIPLAPVGHN